MVIGSCAPRSRSSRRVPALLMALSAVLVSAAASAQAPAVPLTAAAPAVFAIKGFKVTGDNPLGDGETARVLAPYLRSDATLETLQKATAALEAALRDKGFGLHRVALPPQEVGDTVALNIVKFTIGKVTLEGRSVRLEPARAARAPVRIKTNRRTGLPYADMGADAPAVTLGDVKRLLADFP